MTRKFYRIKLSAEDVNTAGKPLEAARDELVEEVAVIRKQNSQPPLDTDAVKMQRKQMPSKRDAEKMILKELVSESFEGSKNDIAILCQISETCRDIDDSDGEVLFSEADYALITKGYKAKKDEWRPPRWWFDCKELWSQIVNAKPEEKEIG